MVDGAGSVILAVTVVASRRKTNSSSASGCVRRSGRGRVGRGEIDLVAVVVAKLEQRGAHLEALGALHEPAPIGAAAELAVGHDLEPDLLLHADGVADAVILDAHELVVADLVAGVAAEGLAQRRRPQQASDVIGAKRRAAVRATCSCFVAPSLAALSIAQ